MARWTPIVPLTGRAVTDCAQLLRSTMLEHSFEPFINVLVIQARATYLLAMIVYDREIRGEDERARACHDQLLQATTDAGWVPHRLATPAASSIPTQQPDLPTLLKRALDPGDILSPGRYVPEAGG